MITPGWEVCVSGWVPRSRLWGEDLCDNDLLRSVPRGMKERKPAGEWEHGREAKEARADALAMRQFGKTQSHGKILEPAELTLGAVPIWEQGTWDLYM